MLFIAKSHKYIQNTNLSMTYVASMSCVRKLYVIQLHMFVENNMDLRQSQRYARLLCEHSDNKRLCGRILHTFTAHMSPAEAASYLYDIVTLDFFQDMRGSMKVTTIPHWFKHCDRFWTVQCTV